MTKHLESTHNLIWRFSYALSCLAFVAWFMYAANNYLKFSASSSVSLKNGDDGDSFVKFPVMSFCKIPDPKLGFWKKVQPCTGSNFATYFFRIRNPKYRVLFYLFSFTSSGYTL